MTKSEKIIEKRISNAFREVCNGIQIDIMDIGKVYAVGRKTIQLGADDIALKAAMRDFVEIIRKN